MWAMYAASWKGAKGGEEDAGQDGEPSPGRVMSRRASIAICAPTCLLSRGLPCLGPPLPRATQSKQDRIAFCACATHGSKRSRKGEIGDVDELGWPTAMMPVYMPRLTSTQPPPVDGCPRTPMLHAYSSHIHVFQCFRAFKSHLAPVSNAHAH